MITTFSISGRKVEGKRGSGKFMKGGELKPESLAMVLARFLPDRSTLTESKSRSLMENTAKTASPAFFELCL
jgi:hypothetical protein